MNFKSNCQIMLLRILGKSRQIILLGPQTHQELPAQAKSRTGILSLSLLPLKQRRLCLYSKLCISPVRQQHFMNTYYQNINHLLYTVKQY